MIQAQELKNQSEIEDSLCKDLQDLQEEEESTQSWLKEQHLKIEFLGEETQLQERMNGAQVRDKSDIQHIQRKQSNLLADMFCLL